MPNFFTERKKKLDKLLAKRPSSKKETPPPAYTVCPDCAADIAQEDLRKNLRVCPRCGYHMPVSARERFSKLFDDGTYHIRFSGIEQKNPLSFPGYAEKTAEFRRRTGRVDACLCAVGQIDGRRAAAVAQETDFMMGSMGVIVGEMIAKTAELALAARLPLIIFCAGGGARMQEGIYSLMQMAKTSGAIRKFSDSGGLYITVITNPTTGGISASYASLGDITLAEPGALFGFAGPRVIEQTIGEKLPEGFQRAEFQMEHGFIDAIVPRIELRSVLSKLLALHERKR